MDLLYVCNGFPFPLTSGYLRHFFLLGELARHHRVTLLSMVGPRFREEDRAALADRTVRVLTFPAGRRGRSMAGQGRARLGLLVARGDPGARHLGAAAAVLRREHRYDAAIFSGRRTFPALSALSGLPLVVDLCDASSLRLRGQLRFAPAARRAIAALDLALTRHVEGQLIRRADHLLFASWRDRQVLLGGAGSPPSTIVPNGVDMDAWRRRTPELGRDTIVFTGAMDYAPNVDAAVRLARSILPRVRARFPAARLLVVGRDPAPQVRALGQGAGVTVTGFVEDMRACLEQASVFAAPLRFGAGIQNKLLEAMAAAVPAVASPVAAAGLRIDPDSPPPVTVATDDEAFVAAIVARLETARHDPTPDRAGSAWVAEHFDWQRSGERLNVVLAGLARRPQPRT